MKKLGHLGVYTLLVFLSIYLLDFSSLYLAKMFVWGMDGYSIIVAVEQLALLGLFIYWLKKKKMLYIFEKKGSIKSRFFYLLVSLVAAYFVRQLLSAFTYSLVASLIITISLKTFFRSYPSMSNLLF